MSNFDPWQDDDSAVYVGSTGGSEVVAMPAVAGTIDRQNCSLMGPFALVVQGMMGLIVLGSLVIKRAKEKGKRPWIVWFADVSKQIIGQLFVHFSNVAISDIIAGKRENACALYFLNILVDTTLGVLLIWGFMRFATYILIEKLRLEEFRSGRYGNPFSWVWWAKQLSVYVTALAVMKVCVVIMFKMFPILVRLGNWSVGWLGEEEAQLAFSMMVFPLVMNVLQFLIVDSILKSSNSDDGSQDFEADYAELATDPSGRRRSSSSPVDSYPPRRKKSLNEDEAAEWQREWDED